MGADKRILLTDGGAGLLGLESYSDNDPSTWPDEDCESYFMRGSCHVLALALTRRFDWDLVVMLVRGFPYHAFAQDGEGRAHDFDGLTSRARMLEDSGVLSATFEVLKDEVAMRKRIGGLFRDYGPYDIAMADKYIDGRPDKFPVANPHPGP